MTSTRRNKKLIGALACAMLLWLLPLCMTAQSAGGHITRPTTKPTTTTTNKKQSTGKKQSSGKKQSTGKKQSASSNNPPSQPTLSNQTFTVNGVSFTMVAVQGGTFTMGATAEQGSDVGSDEKPTHQVTLSSFHIGQTEVTQELWQAVMGNNPSKFRGVYYPVEKVSWDDCQAFIAKLNALTGRCFRLPTEAEWEYAARGGNKSQGYKYAGSNTLANVAWYRDNSVSSTHDVATKSPNELGLYDMSGNVWEWCQDWKGSYSSSSQTNPKGPSSGSYRVYRGGSWDVNAGLCRVSNRYDTPSFRGRGLGLRLAL